MQREQWEVRRRHKHVHKSSAPEEWGLIIRAAHLLKKASNRNTVDASCTVQLQLQLQGVFSRLAAVLNEMSAQISRVCLQQGSQRRPAVSLMGNWPSGKTNNIIHNHSQRNAPMQRPFRLNNAKCHSWSWWTSLRRTFLVLERSHGHFHEL